LQVFQINFRMACNDLVKMKILDATLRDGGYYNNWDFSVDFINKYLLVANAVGIDIVEIGFRSLNFEIIRGRCAHISERLIDELCIPENLSIATMINASELPNFDSSDETVYMFKSLFRKQSPSQRQQYIRIAARFSDLPNIGTAVKFISGLGYKVIVNIMQISELDSVSLSSAGSILKSLPIEVLYFADSLGSLKSQDIKVVVENLSSGWDGELGIHSHDNMRNALSNTLTAFNHGVNWLDSTISGMGRGPGNCRTEELLVSLQHQGRPLTNIEPLIQFIAEDIEPLRQKYGWGTNIYYFMTAMNRIHPSYVQEMLADSRYDHHDMIAVLDMLTHKNDRKSLYEPQVQKPISYFSSSKGNWRPSAVLESIPILILGSGPSCIRYRPEIERFIKDNSIVVLSLNKCDSISPNLVDFIVACHPVRIRAELDKHMESEVPMISPLDSFDEDIQSRLLEKNCLDFGINVLPDTFEFGDTACVCPNNLSLSYSLAIAASGKASTIYLAGIDGYEHGDPRNLVIQTTFNHFTAAQGTLKPVSITPTSFPELKKQSIFSLLK